jgi:hypothetical protein
VVEHKCPYSGTLVSEHFACAMARTVVRRGGPEVACTSETGHKRCASLFQQMKQVALPVFGVEDDLLTMPHSVLIKIQHGGLLGLQRIMGEASGEASAVADIHGLCARAVARYQEVVGIPCDTFVQDMTAYKLKRRGVK